VRVVSSSRPLAQNVRLTAAWIRPMRCLARPRAEAADEGGSASLSHQMPLKEMIGLVVALRTNRTPEQPGLWVATPGSRRPRQITKERRTTRSKTALRFPLSRRKLGIITWLACRHRESHRGSPAIGHMNDSQSVARYKPVVTDGPNLALLESGTGQKGSIVRWLDCRAVTCWGSSMSAEFEKYAR
jgi:hypothetical protein